MLGIRDFLIKPSDDPEILPEGLTPAQTVEELAHRKAVDVALKSDGESLIIAADTIVCLDRRIIGKPESKEDAARMLRSLSGKTHTVYTGISLICGERELSGVESTDVSFRELSDAEILDYIETGEPMDKAGSYGAQGLGALFVKGINGDFFNVMGLPIFRLGLMLRFFGIDVLNL
jgi:septum formation protein